MKISLTGLLLNDSRMHTKLSKILTDDNKPVSAELALDLLIQEYVNLRLGGTSDLIGQSRFIDREFVLQVPNDGPAVIQRSKLLSHLTITMPISEEQPE
jgi:hypothetical protein